MLKWLRKQKGLTKILVEILDHIDKLGYAQSISHASQLVEYYTTNRKHTLAELLAWPESWYWRNFPHIRLMPKQIVLEALPRVKAILQRGEVMVAKKRKQEQAREQITKAFALWREEVQGIASHEERLELLSDLCAIPVDAKAVSFGPWTMNVRLASGFYIHVRLRQISSDMISHNDQKGSLLLQKAMPKSIRLVVAGDGTIQMHPDDETAMVATAVVIRRQAREKAEKQRLDQEAKRLAEREELKRKAGIWIESQIKTTPALVHKMALRPGRNLKNGEQQFECRRSGLIYVLERNERYQENEGECYFATVMALTSRVFLVGRLYWDPTIFAGQGLSGWFVIRRREYIPVEDLLDA